MHAANAIRLGLASALTIHARVGVHAKSDGVLHGAPENSREVLRLALVIIRNHDHHRPPRERRSGRLSKSSIAQIPRPALGPGQDVPGVVDVRGLEYARLHGNH